MASPEYRIAGRAAFRAIFIPAIVPAVVLATGVSAQRSVRSINATLGHWLAYHNFLTTLIWQN
jgi:hypothetical protein